MNEARFMGALSIAATYLNNNKTNYSLNDLFLTSDEIINYITEKELKENPPKIQSHPDLLQSLKDPIFFLEQTFIEHPVKGQIPFILYQYQKRLIHHFQQNKHIILCAARQMGKTSLLSRYILWKTLFISNYSVLICANNLRNSIEIMDRIRFAFETLPPHLKTSIKVYNKQNIVFDNGSSIIARPADSCSGRGVSINMLYVDEMAFLPYKTQDEFWASLMPTISSGSSCIISSTPNAPRGLFYDLWEKSMRINNPAGMKPIKLNWREHPERDELWAAEFRNKLGDERFRREFECEFVSIKDQ